MVPAQRVSAELAVRSNHAMARGRARTWVLVQRITDRPGCTRTADGLCDQRVG